MRTIAATLFAAIFVAPLIAADTKMDAEAAARAVAPFLDEQTFAVAQVDLSRLDVPALHKFLTDLLQPNEAELKEFEQASQALSKVQAVLVKAGLKQLFMIASLEDVPGEPPFFVLPLPDGTDVKQIRTALEGIAPLTITEMHQALVLSESNTSKRLVALKKPAPIPGLAKGLEAGGESAIRLLLFPTPALRKAAEEIMPTLPREVGGGSSSLFTRELQWLALGINLPPTLALHLEIQCQDEKAAKTIHTLIGSLYKQIESENRDQIGDIGKLVTAFTPTVKDSRLVLDVDEKSLETALVLSVQFRREEVQRTIALTSLRQIGVAMHGFLAEKKTFPPVANFSKDKKALLSWRVHLLPYLGQQKLYEQFHLDEAWDSEHNQKLIGQMPAIYRGLNKKLSDAGKTPWVVPVGESTMFPPGGEPVKPAQVTVGLSSVAMAIEVDDEHAVIWTKPEDLVIDPKNPGKGLAKRKRTGEFLLLLGDGSVQSLKLDKIDTKALNALFTKDAGEKIKLP